MGTSSAKVCETQNRFKSPEFFWFFKDNKTVLKINEQSVVAHQMNSLTIFDLCAVGYTAEFNIVLAGGIKNSGKMSKKVFYVNVVSKSISRLRSLKIPSAGCSLIISQNNLFLIPESLKHPLQIYTSGDWAIIDPAALNLISPASFFNESKLYFLCSTKSNSKPTKKIYTLPLSSPIQYTKLPTLLPFKLEKPILVKVKNQIVLAGGKVNGKPNSQFFIGSLECDNWKIIDGPRFVLYSAPGISADSSAIWVEYPKIVILSEMVCYVWNISENSAEGGIKVQEKSKLGEKKNKPEKKVEKNSSQGVSFKKLEFKEKKIIGNKNYLEDKILQSKKINEQLYLRSDEKLSNEEIKDKLI